MLCFAILVVAGSLLMEMCATKNMPEQKGYTLTMNEAKTEFEKHFINRRFSLAPTYGNLDSKSLKSLDVALKVMISGIFELDTKRQYNWMEIRAVLDSNPLLLRDPSYSILRMAKLPFTSYRALGRVTNKDNRRRDFLVWFTNLVGNVDVLKDTRIQLEEIAMLISNFRANILSNFMSETNKQMVLIDQGILHFPDITKPYFSLFRINLMGKSTYKSYLVHQTETTDIVGLFQRELYYPDREYIKSLSPGVINDALHEIDDLFNDK